MRAQLPLDSGADKAAAPPVLFSARLASYVLRSTGKHSIEFSRVCSGIKSDCSAVQPWFRAGRSAHQCHLQNGVKTILMTLHLIVRSVLVGIATQSEREGAKTPEGQDVFHIIRQHMNNENKIEPGHRSVLHQSLSRITGRVVV